MTVMPYVRLLIAAGDLRDGDVIPSYCTVRWLARDGRCVAFGPTTDESQQQALLPVDMDVWVERFVADPTVGVAPLPVAKVHR